MTTAKTTPTVSQKFRTHWWGVFELDEGVISCWEIGPLKLYVERGEALWRVGFWRSKDAMESAINYIREYTEEVDPATKWERFTPTGDSQISIELALADRPVVSLPVDAHFLAPKSAITFFIGSPLWIRLKDGEGNILKDTPIFPPKETWFGPLTYGGELCYASRTYCNTDLDNIPFYPHRAVTAVTIENNSALSFPLDKIKLPVNSLSAYVAEGHRIWTQDCVYKIGGEGQMLHIKMKDKPPLKAPRTKHLCDARVPFNQGMLISAITSLL